MHEYDADDLLLCYVGGYALVYTEGASWLKVGYLVAEFIPPMDATVVQLLTESGASVVGKTNCDEFGMGYVFDLVDSMAPLNEYIAPSMYTLSMAQSSIRFSPPNDDLLEEAQEEVRLLLQPAFAMRKLRIWLHQEWAPNIMCFPELSELIPEARSVCLPLIVASSG